MSWQAEAWVQSNPHITSQMDYCVMVTLANWCNEKGQWSPSWQTWAKAARCSVISVRRAVERLQAAGILSIVVAGRAGRTNTYQINMPGYALPSLKPDEADDVVAHALQQAAKRDRQLSIEDQNEQHSAAPDIHNHAHQMSSSQISTAAHSEHHPAHPDEHHPAHPDEHQTISNNQLQPRAEIRSSRDAGWEPDPEKRKRIAAQNVGAIRAAMAQRRGVDLETGEIAKAGA